MSPQTHDLVLIRNCSIAIRAGCPRALANAAISFCVLVKSSVLDNPICHLFVILLKMLRSAKCHPVQFHHSERHCAAPCSIPPCASCQKPVAERNSFRSTSGFLAADSHPYLLTILIPVFHRRKPRNPSKHLPECLRIRIPYIVHNFINCLMAILKGAFRRLNFHPLRIFKWRVSRSFDKPPVEIPATHGKP